jgi:hypothetical protein
MVVVRYHKKQTKWLTTHNPKHPQSPGWDLSTFPWIESNCNIGNIRRRKWSCGRVYDIVLLPKGQISWLQLLNEHVLLNINSNVVLHSFWQAFRIRLIFEPSSFTQQLVVKRKKSTRIMVMHTEWSSSTSRSRSPMLSPLYSCFSTLSHPHHHPHIILFIWWW